MNKDFHRLYVYWFVSRPFLLDCRLYRMRRLRLRGSASLESGAQISPSGAPCVSKSKSKLLFNNSRFSELFINIPLLSLSAYLILRTPKLASGYVEVKSYLGGKVIFHMWLDSRETVIMPVWEGSFLSRTQKVTYTTVQNMEKIVEKNLDTVGRFW